MAHTERPWREYESDSNKWIGNAVTGEIVCDMPHINYRDDRLEVRWKSNAPLLAAAPDLLAALENLLLELDGDISLDAERQARAAIARAKGEQ